MSVMHPLICFDIFVFRSYSRWSSMGTCLNLMTKVGKRSTRESIVMALVGGVKMRSLRMGSLVSLANSFRYRCFPGILCNLFSYLSFCETWSPCSIDTILCFLSGSVYFTPFIFCLIKKLHFQVLKNGQRCQSLYSFCMY